MAKFWASCVGNNQLILCQICFGQELTAGHEIGLEMYDGFPITGLAIFAGL
jgi:hypothetical protein